MTGVQTCALPIYKIAAMAEQGFVTLQDDRLTATPQGRLLLNRVIEKLVA